METKKVKAIPAPKPNPRIVNVVEGKGKAPVIDKVSLEDIMLGRHMEPPEGYNKTVQRPEPTSDVTVIVDVSGPTLYISFAKPVTQTRISYLWDSMLIPIDMKYENGQQYRSMFYRINENYSALDVYKYILAQLQGTFTKVVGERK